MNIIQERYFARLGESGSEELYDDGRDLVAMCAAGDSIHLDPSCGPHIGTVGADGHWTNTVADNYKGPFKRMPDETLSAFHIDSSEIFGWQYIADRQRRGFRV